MLIKYAVWWSWYKVRDGIQFKLREDLAVDVEEEFETIFIEALNGPKSTLIGEIYRVPNTNAKSSLEMLSAIFERLSASKARVIVGGDLNFDMLKINSHRTTSDMLSHALSAGLIPCITKPTRVTQSTATLIYNIGNYNKYSITSGVILSDISDHLPVFLCTKNTCKKEGNCHI